METAPTSIEVLLRPTLGQSDKPLIYVIPTSVYNTWQSQAVTHAIMNRARRSLTSVIDKLAVTVFLGLCESSSIISEIILGFILLNALNIIILLYSSY